MVNLRPLSDELAKKATVELNEVPERIEADIEALKVWIKKTPHLKCRMDDQFLVTFLRGCKYSLEKTKQKIDLFYTTRTLMPEMFLGRDPLEQKALSIIKLGVALPLPLTLAHDSPRIMLIRPGVYDASAFHIQDIMKVSTMVQDILMWEDDNMIIGGQVGILDLSNVTMAHFLQFNPTFIKKMTMMSQEASPLRQKGFHYVNTPVGFESIFNLFKSFMNEKNKSRLYVHGSNMESLYQHVPRKLLPSEYGGEAGPFQDIIDVWERKILSYRDFIKEEDLYGTDEKKRRGPPKNAETLFGIEGSFRQLNVD